MIIGHYHPEIWAPGGIATYIRRISDAQRIAGHQVFFFSDKEYHNLQDADMPIVVDSHANLFQQALFKRLDILHIHRPILSVPPKNIPVIRTLHGHEPYCPNGGKYLKRWEKPCERIYSPHGCLWGHFVDRCGSIRPQNLIHNWQQLYAEKSILSAIPVITVSQFLKDCMVKSGYPAESIKVLHLFAPDSSDVTAFPNTKVPNFLFVGRISPQKGLAWLLKSLPKVNVPIHLDVVGHGDQESDLRLLAKNLGVDSYVNFHGWINFDQIEKLISSARALVFPSVWHEPAGLVALEAMSHSKAVIASNVGGIPEMVFHNKNGILVEPNNTQELASAIELIASDELLAQKLGQEGKTLVYKKFSLETHLNQLMEIYRQVSYEIRNS